MTKLELKRLGVVKVVRKQVGVTIEEQMEWITSVRKSLDEQGADTVLEHGNIVCNSGQFFTPPMLSSQEEGTMVVRSKDIVFTPIDGTPKYCELTSIEIAGNIITVKDTAITYELAK